MSRSKRLRPIADLAAHHEKEASRQLADTQTRLSGQERLLEELLDYHAEYTTANISTHVASADPVRLQDYRLFIDRLEHAISRQRELLARLREELDKDHLQWSDRRTHRKALDNVTDRYARTEARESDRREQRHLEEVCSLLRTRRQHLA